jgi:Uri superfamily endonuclease
MSATFDPDSLPAAGGAYVVEFHLEKAGILTIGKLGQAFFSAGLYLYMGSAAGPGGLRARLGRHLRPAAARPHWHIDYLHRAARPAACAYLALPPGGAPGSPLECLWSQALAALPGAGLPLAGFGASDCRAGCCAHLVHFHKCASDLILLENGSLQTALADAVISLEGSQWDITVVL